MYLLSLCHAECHTLEWAAARGYFPEDLSGFLSQKMSALWEKHHATPTSSLYGALMHEQHLIEIPEHLVWSLLDMREDDPHSYLACIGGDLLTKLTSLESAIV